MNMHFAPMSDGPDGRQRETQQSQTSQEKAARHLARLETIETVIEGIGLATWEWDLVTDEVFWNEQHFRLMGREVEDKSQQSAAFLDQIHPDDQAWVTAELSRCIAGQQRYDAEFRIVRADDGAVKWMRGYGRVTGTDEGRPVRMSGVMFDITQHKQTQRSLRQSEERQRAILESARDYAIISLDVDRRISSWNAGAEQMMGYTENEIIGQSGDIFFVPEDRAKGAPEGEVARTLETGRAENERWHLRKDGSRFYGSGVTTPLLNDNGQVVGVLKVMRNLTAQKKAEEALLEADRRKDEFLALLAHELRNPMAIVSNTLMLLEMSGGKQQVLPLDTALGMMRREITQLVRLVDDLLDISRINQGKIVLQMSQIDIARLVREAVQATRPLFSAAHQQVAEDIPAGPVYLHGDAPRLTQVIRNLLTNASKFTDKHGHISVSLRHHRPEVIIRVKDDGIGIPSDELERIFDLFAQVDASRTRAHGGLGLGLTLVKEFVEKHGGRVEAQSPGLGQGSTFSIYLPLSNNH